MGVVLATAGGFTAAACGMSEAPPRVSLEGELPGVEAPAPRALGTFQEHEARDVITPVRGSAARIDQSRIGALAYEVAYVSESGTRTSLTRPSPNHPLNPLVEARRYGDKTLTCVNSFADERGTSPRVECFWLVSKTGEILGRRVIEDAWIRTMPEAGPRVYLSPHGIVNYEENYGFTCRALTVDDSGMFTYDASQPTDCDESPVVVPKEKRQGPRGTRERLARYAMALPSGPDDSAEEHVPILPEDAGTNDAGGGGELPATPVDRCNAPYPEANLETQTFEPPNLPGLDRIASSFLVPDYPKPGLSWGFRFDLDGAYTKTTNTNHCLENAWDGWITGNLQVSLGVLQGTGSVEYRSNGSRCSTLNCIDDGATDRWACGHPDGERSNETLGLEFGLGGQFPLDTIPNPAIRAICLGRWNSADAGTPAADGGDAGTTGGNGVSCNVDWMVKGGYRKQENSAHGRSSCGTDCANGRDKRFLEERYTLNGTGSIEIEVAAGPLGNGRAGASIEFEGARGNRDEQSCDSNSTSTYTCARARAIIYASGCPGYGPFTYCFDYRHTVFRTVAGDCPPFGLEESGESPGTAAGRACAQHARRFFTWDTYRAQCEQCCNSLPASPFDVQPPSEFDRDCKAQCADL
jgi:hypothetical protein